MAWSKRPEVQDAWVRLAERHGLEVDAFEKGTWMFLGIVLGRNYDIVISMSKARRLGWTGYDIFPSFSRVLTRRHRYKDTWEAFSDTFDKLEREKILPKSYS